MMQQCQAIHLELTGDHYPLPSVYWERCKQKTDDTCKGIALCTVHFGQLGRYGVVRFTRDGGYYELEMLHKKLADPT